MNDYIGNELEIFKEATNWKSYLGQQISPFLGEKVAEVGAGLGVNTKLLCREKNRSWLCIEPDSSFSSAIDDDIEAGNLPPQCSVLNGTMAALPPGELFDSILYIDVLEHIEDDFAEVQLAFDHLAPGGHLIVLCPAHQFLFSPFDEAIGHFRRYDKARYRSLTSQKIVRLRYLDSAGVSLSLANQLLLRQSQPTITQIRFWDRKVIPVSRVLDRFSGYLLGKSVLGVWQKGIAD